MPPQLPALSVNARETIRALAESLKEARLERRMTQQSLAERLGVSRYTVMAMERGDARVGIGIFIESAAIFGLLEPTESQERRKVSFLPKRGRRQAVKLDDNF